MNLQKTIDAFAKLREEKIKLEKESMESLATFFKEKNIDEVVIRGSTPSFNDGDPCSHSTQVIATFDEYHEIMFWEDQENMNEAIEEKLVELRKNNFIESVKEEKSKVVEDNIFNRHLSEEDAKMLSSFLYEISDYFERSYHTNFQVTLKFDKETGKINEVHEDYYED